MKIIKSYDIDKEVNPNDKVINLDGLKEWSFQREKYNEIISISFCLKFKTYLCRPKLSSTEMFYMKLYSRSEEIINSNLDIVNYLKFMQEYIHLKCLLFNDVQTLCFSFMKKHKVYEKNRFLKINSKSYKKLKEIILFYRDNKDLSPMDNKIYELLSDDVKDLIKRYK
jgi:hypothetical protein